jgi:hypothetical protein
MELEDQIFRRGLPKEQWQQAYEESLSKYPGILPYKRLFDRILSHAESANEQIEELWKRDVHGHELVDESNPNVIVADSVASAKIFEYVFRHKPKKKVSAYKGAITIRLLMDSKEFEKFGFSRGRAPGGFALPVGGQDFSVIAINKDKESVNGTIIHEVEHAKNDVFRNERNNYALDWWDSVDSTEENIKNRLARRDIEELHAQESHEYTDESRAKEEILAYLTILEYAPPDFSSKSMDKFCKDITNVLVSPTSFYNIKNEKAVLDGFEAFTTLLKHYEENGSTFQKSSRLVINTLEQFPLTSWPAVARLIKYRHQNQQKH